MEYSSGNIHEYLHGGKKRGTCHQRFEGLAACLWKKENRKNISVEKDFPRSQLFCFNKVRLLLVEGDDAFSTLNVEDAVRLIGSLLDKGETVVLDEFQRLPADFGRKLPSIIRMGD